MFEKSGPLKSAFIHQQQTRAAKKEILIHLISSTKCRPCPQFFFCKLLVPELLLSLTSSFLRGSTYSKNGERLEQLSLIAVRVSIDSVEKKNSALDNFTLCTTQWARKFKKFQAKKLVKSNKSISRNFY